MDTIILLTTVFAVFACISKVATGRWNFRFGGNLAMVIMLCFTALGHILFTKGMSLMIPPFIPYGEALVYITGFVEIVLGCALLPGSSRSYAAYALIVFFILILPANIYGAIIKVDLEKGTLTGPGTGYLWFRIPLQFFFIGWLYYFSIRKAAPFMKTRSLRTIKRASQPATGR